MTTPLIIGDRTIDIAAYKTAAMEEAAPAFDRLMAPDFAAIAAAPAVGAISFVRVLLEIIEPGARRVDPAITLGTLRDAFGVGDIEALLACVGSIIKEAGLDIDLTGMFGDAPAGEAAPSPEPEVAAA